MKSEARSRGLSKLHLPAEFIPTTELHKTLKKSGVRDPFDYLDKSEEGEAKHLVKMWQDFTKEERRVISLDDLLHASKISQEKAYGIIQADLVRERGTVDEPKKTFKKVANW